LAITGNPLSVWEQFDINKGQSFGVQLNIPILNGLSVRNNVARSKVLVKRSELALEQETLNLERNVFTAYSDAQGAQKAYEAAVTALEARKEAYFYASERYQVGLLNTYDLNQAQNLLTAAESEVLRTKYDYLFRTKILALYFGLPIYERP
jgi:outer membrane protein